MFHLNRLDLAQKRSIQEKRFLFLKDPDIPGFNRFFSADSSFPCSIATPSPAVGLFKYWDIENKEMEFAGGNFVSRYDLSRWVSGGGFWGNLASNLLSGAHDVAWYLEQREQHMTKGFAHSGLKYPGYKIHRRLIQVGTIKTADCVVRDNGIMAAIVGNDGGLWCIGVEGSSEEKLKALKAFARSFLFLAPQFFSDLQRLMGAP